LILECTYWGGKLFTGTQEALEFGKRADNFSNWHAAMYVNGYLN
jgi:hypothetical protein